MADTKERMRSLLHRRFRVTLVDGRVLIGDFQCLDKQGNIILGNTSESVLSASGKPEDRHMGMVLIPCKQRKDVELLVSTEEKMSMLKLVEA